MAGPPKPEGWLLFIHQFPPKPAYLRVKAWRRLNALGAVTLKGGVSALPNRDDCMEDLQWLRKDIVADGGEATIVAARLVDGMTDAEIIRQFNAARDADYAGLLTDLRGADAAGRARLQKRFEEIAAIDFFAAPGRKAVERALAPARKTVAATPRAMPRDAVWVTRRDVHVDRIASAWLIKRFIDPGARFRFIEPRAAKRPGEIRFDMFEAEFTHEGDLCTFEVLLKRAGIADKALVAIGEVIHDLDLKDGKFARAETAGIGMMLAAIERETEDQARLERGATLFDDLHRQFRKRA